ncbi:MAG: hypothetical protein K2X42_05615 [Burkholderiaceae bacterium]|nr:hypothetical protein [Burkholderiaceae bacterium]
MPRAAHSALLAASLLATLTTAQAQPAAAAARPDPLDPKASVPTLRYESSFAQYRRLGEEKPVSWRDANDTVTRIGGWRVYAREAQQPDPAPTTAPESSPAAKPADTPPAAKPVPMPAGHGGHKMP